MPHLLYLITDDFCRLPLLFIKYKPRTLHFERRLYIHIYVPSAGLAAMFLLHYKQTTFCIVSRNLSTYLLIFLEPRNRVRGILSASYVAWRAGTTNRVVVRGPPGWKSIPGLLKRSTNTGSGGDGAY